MEVIWWR